MRQLSFPMTLAALATLALLAAAPRPGLAAPRGASAATTPAVRVVEVTSAHVHLHDLVALGSMPDVDLGPAPALGSTRTIDRDELLRALAGAHATGASAQLPIQIRVVRKSRRITTAELDRLVRAAIDPARLPRGATVITVRGLALDVPEGFDHVTAELPAPVRRSGAVTVTAAVAFVASGDIVARTTVSIELGVPPEALVPDVAKGAPITLVIRHGLVEVSIGAVAGADGDTGGTLPVLLKPSGRVVRARIVDKDHAVALEDS